jgi:hypothetical protein
MPIPKPRKQESKESFMDRCLSNEIMNSEYPDTDQRYAICASQWRNRKKSPKKVITRRIGKI